MQSGTGYCVLDRTALGDLVREIHFGGGKHSSRPAELSRPDPFHRVVSSSPGVQ